MLVTLAPVASFSCFMEENGPSAHRPQRELSRPSLLLPRVGLSCQQFLQGLQNSPLQGANAELVKAGCPGQAL